MKRCVEPEILDELEASDPRAVQSRADLRLINTFMRGEDWILSALEAHNVTQVIELGAGAGSLVNKVAERYPEASVVGLDFIQKPQGVAERVDWVSGDLLEYEGFDENAIVVANLFLHHLSAEQLRELGRALSSVKVVLFSEPLRALMPLLMGRCLFPVVNDVTRHDMMVSIRAGFKAGELPALLGRSFLWEESRGVFGGLRIKGVRK